MYFVFYCSYSFLLDGRPQWEVEAKIIREKSQGVSSCLFILSVIFSLEYFFLFKYLHFFVRKCFVCNKDM